MKKIFLFICVSLLVVSCSDNSSEGISKVTNYPVLTLHGDEFYQLAAGEVFEDPGITATEGGEEIDYVTTIKGSLLGTTTLDTNVADEYTITYTATNVDGFSASITRTVLVVKTGDFADDFSGYYKATVVRNGVGGAAYTDMEYILIVPSGANSYRLSDGIGGYYDIGRAYGPTYRAPATINVNNFATDDFTIPDFTVGTFGGNVEMTSFVVNESDHSIDFSADWDSGYTFVVHLEQVQF